MTNTKRWLDELPASSQERELLLVGKAARPAPGAIDANWQSLCLALGTTAAASVVTSSVAASSLSAAASAPVGSSLVVGKAASAGLLVVAAKSLAVGVGLGLAVMGAAAVAERASTRSEPTPTTKPAPALTARRSPTESLPTPIPTGNIAAAPSSSLFGATTAAPPLRERPAASSPAFNQADVPTPTPAAVAPDKAASLSQQARELAELKRLIDSGATAEALRRLDKSFTTDSGSVLTEERDALYVQALARAQRRAEARAFARRFLARYPHSPYFETMRQLLAEE